MKTSISDDPTPVTLLRRMVVQSRTGLSRSAIYALIAKGDFPAGVKLTAKAVAWPSNQVDAWISQRIKSSAEGRIAT